MWMICSHCLSGCQLAISRQKLGHLQYPTLGQEPAFFDAKGGLLDKQNSITTSSVETQSNWLRKRADGDIDDIIGGYGSIDKSTNASHF